MEGTDQFVISNGTSYYLVTINENTSQIEPMAKERFQTQNLTVSKSLYLIAQSMLTIKQPTAVRDFLIKHFEAKGWFIEGITGSPLAF